MLNQNFVCELCQVILTKSKSYYENLVQIGDMFDTHCVNDPQTAKLAKNALITYFDGDPRRGIKSYAERNPQFYVFDAVVHMDENTPHLHLAYIPVATGYKNGMSVQNSHDKALRACLVSLHYQKKEV